jgi:hypothetical protein
MVWPAVASTYSPSILIAILSGGPLGGWWLVVIAC